MKKDEKLSKETVDQADSSRPTIAETNPGLVEKEKARLERSANAKSGKNSPVIGDNRFNLEAGDNTRFLSINLELMNMPNIDMTNVDEVQHRLSEYFTLYAKYDIKPTVVGMAIALNGHSRKWLWSVTHDAPLGGRGNMCGLPKPCTDAIKKAYFLLESLWENYMNSGKVNPVAGIFLGKNNYGYKDQTEYVVTPNTKLEEQYSTEDIQKRYITPEPNKRLSTHESDEK